MSGPSQMTCRQRDVAHLNGRFRLGAAGQMIELRQAENDPIGAFRIIGLNVRFRITKPVVLCGAVATLSSLTHTVDITSRFLTTLS